MPLPLARAWLWLALASFAHAGTFTHSFNSVATDAPSGALNTALTLPGGLLNGVAANATVISSRKDANNAGTVNVSAIKANVGTTSDTALRLADRTTSSCFAALVLPVIDAKDAVTEFTVTLRLLMDRAAGATPADGFNISFGPQLNGTGGASGHTAIFGLVVNFDTYQNAISDPRSIEVLADGRSVGNFLASNLPGGNFTFDQNFRLLTLHWAATTGLDLSYDGITIFSRLPTPGFVPGVGFNFAFNAATGGLMQDVFIDDLSITTVAPARLPLATQRLVIEEIMADNTGGLEDEDLDHPDWIDLYNGTTNPVNLAGWRLEYTAPVVAGQAAPTPISYSLPALVLPAYGHQIVFASGKNRFTNVRPHASFKLLKEGGTLKLFQPDGTTLEHSLSYGAQQENVAYGGVGTNQTPGFLETATPGADNHGRQAPNKRLAAPLFFRADSGSTADQPSAVLATPLTLGLQLPADAPAGAVMRYTLNLTEPDEASPLYSAPLSITTGTAVKARVFAPGHLPSRTGNRAFVFLSSAADTTATNLVNVANNYNGSGQPFSSNLPILVLDSFQRNVDELVNPLGLRPFRPTQIAVYDVKPGTNRASLAEMPDQVRRGGTHVRGQSSSTQPERPYALEFWQEDSDDDRDEPLLGMPAHSDWVLQSLAFDKSLLRNFLLQQAMLEANGPGAGMRCRFVEVFFNQDNSTVDYGDYRGIYLLMEKVSRGKQRVDIAKLNDSMSAPELISGGYIFKADKLPFARRINAASDPAIPGSSRDYDVYEPDPVTDAQAEALTAWLNRMTTALAAPDFSDPTSPNYHGRWIDAASFIDKMLWYELSKETDAYAYSYYFSKDRNGLMSGFPLWDVDRSLGNSSYGYANSTFGMKWWVVGANYTYYPRLQQDPEFVDRTWNRWTALRRSHLSKDRLFNRIESVYTLLTDGNRSDIVSSTNAATMAVQVPAARHFRKYPQLGTTSFPGGQGGQANRTTWRQEVDAMKSWLAERLEWMDGAPLATDAATLVERLRPTELLNAATGTTYYGGTVAPGYRFRLHNPNPTPGITYFTIDGADPRQTGGALDPTAQVAAASTVTQTSLLAAGQTWKWLLPTAAPANDAAGMAWTSVTYADANWSSGPAPLGYGESNGLATVIAATAPNYTAANAEPGPAYFRTTFNATGVNTLTAAAFEVMADDGAVIYLNGVEAARVNFPLAPTPATYGQEALGPIDPGNNFVGTETLFVRVPFDRSMLREGINTLAVEVHQATYEFPPSPANPYPRNDFSDLRFDLRVVGLTQSAPGEAIPLPSGGIHTVRTRIRSGSNWSPLSVATFALDAVPANATNLVISELHYHPADPTPDEIARGFTSGTDFEFIELLNASRTQTVDLSGVKLEDGVTFDFNTLAPDLRLLPPGGRIVLAGNAAAFAARLEPGAAPVIRGVFTGNLSNSGEQLTLRGADGTVLRRFSYGDASPWPEEADGQGFSLVLSSPAANPALASSWHASPPRALAAPRPTPAAPLVSAAPNSATTLLGGGTMFTVTASGVGPLWYQWYKDGAPVEGANRATFYLGAATTASAGTYTAVVGNEGGTVTSPPATLKVVSGSMLSNLSIRTRLTAPQALTLGAVIGNGSRNILIRAAGPALNGFGLTGLPDPRLDLFPAGAQAPAASNEDWPASLAGAFGAAGAFPFPAGSKDAALLQTLTGAFTVRASGAGTGIILVEAYDTGGDTSGRLINVSARNRVGTGEDIMIAGFSVTGSGSKQVLIRAVGPTLATFGLAGFLADPILKVVDGRGATVGTNDNWTATLAPTFNQVGAFPLTAGSRDAALLLTVPAGSTYTIQVSGVNNTTGEALVEVYEVF